MIFAVVVVMIMVKMVKIVVEMVMMVVEMVKMVVEMVMKVRVRRVPPRFFLVFEPGTKPTCGPHTSSYVQVKM